MEANAIVKDGIAIVWKNLENGDVTYGMVPVVPMFRRQGPTYVGTSENEYVETLTKWRDLLPLMPIAAMPIFRTASQRVFLERVFEAGIMYGFLKQVKTYNCPMFTYNKKYVGPPVTFGPDMKSDDLYHYDDRRVRPHFSWDFNTKSLYMELDIDCTELSKAPEDEDSECSFMKARKTKVEYISAEDVSIDLYEPTKIEIPEFIDKSTVTSMLDPKGYISRWVK